MSRFCPLFSSSAGNCIYIGGADGAVLVDAGVSARQITMALARLDIPLETIRGILVTHEHSDHISGLRVFASRNHLPVYASAGTLDALARNGCADGRFETYAAGAQAFTIAGMEVQPFHTLHDCKESLGYVLTLPDGRRAGIATDLGKVTDAVLEALTGCDLVLLESNHDYTMLRDGPYPLHLKQRILSQYGHLSNEACASTAAMLLQSGTTRFFLGHLSQENNTPAAAHAQTSQAFAALGAHAGSDYVLEVAPRCDAQTIMLF